MNSLDNFLGDPVLLATIRRPKIGLAAVEEELSKPRVAFIFRRHQSRYQTTSSKSERLAGRGLCKRRHHEERAGGELTVILNRAVLSRTYQRTSKWAAGVNTMME
eukprot:scaffold823_cov219-Amphora_coffeaeformis.AAC.1